MRAASTIREISIALGGDHPPVLMKYRDGTKDLFTIRENWTKHPYRLAQYRDVARRAFIDDEYARLVAAGETPLIIDGGANIGASALFFAWRYPKARILAIEPEAETFGLLKLNCEAQGAIHCIRAALASAPGMLAVLDPGRSTDAYRVGPLGEDVDRAIGEVAAVTIGQLIEEAAGASPLLVKLDIEGAEAELFSANVEWLDSFPALAIELHDWMLPGQARSANFLREVAIRNRDFINPSQTDIIFSLRNAG